MINDERHEPATDVLNDGGAQIAKELKELLNNLDLHLDESLRFALARNFANYSTSLLNQLGLLHKLPIFRNGTAKLASQFSYELTMVRSVLANQEKVKGILGGDNQSIADLVFAILISDIGKAGPIKSNEGYPSAVIERIFNQAIFTEVHKEWLKNASPDSFPTPMKETIEALPEADRKNIFENGVFFALPIDAYLHVIKQVAFASAKESKELIAKAEELFTLTEKERNFLLLLGVNTEKTPTRSFFTNSHIRFGRLFMSRKGILNAEQKKVVPMALSHHLSQGVLPKGMDVNSFLNDRALLRNTAFLEILDKFDAFYSRFKEKGVDAARASTWKAILGGLNDNYNQYPDFLTSYREIFDEMANAGII
jgi:hypothetical protein